LSDIFPYNNNSQILLEITAMAKKRKKTKKKKAKKKAKKTTKKKIKKAKKKSATKKHVRRKKKPAHVVIVNKIKKLYEESAGRPNVVFVISSLCDVLTDMVIPEGKLEWINKKLLGILTIKDPSSVQVPAAIKILSTLVELGKSV
jgi:hypothetical protein